MTDAAARLPPHAEAAAVRGTRQADRVPPALAPDWFLVDERRPEDWMALLAAQARHLALPGLDGSASGRWSVLFDRQEILLLARLASEPGPAGPAVAPAGTADGADALRRELAQRRAALEHWAQLLQDCDGEGAARLLQMLRGPLQQELEEGLQRIEQAALSDAPGREELVEYELRSVIGLLAEARRQLRQAAREQLARASDSGRHDPAAALLATVVELYGTVQRHVNGFTQRLIDCHVDEVLGMRPRPAVPDRVLLLAQRQRGAQADPVLPAGTRLSAGRDAAGRDIVFRTLDELVVSDAQVAALATLRLERDPLLSPEHELGYVCRAGTQELPLGAATDASLPVWPLFGGTELPSPQPARPASLGLAVASRQLLLLEGEREIRLTLHLDDAAVADPRTQQLVAELLQLANVGPLLPATLPATLQALFERYAALESGLLRRGQPRAQHLAVLALPRLPGVLAALPAPERRDGGREPARVRLHRLFLLLRAQQARGEHFRFATGRLFAHWLLSAPQADWIGAEDREALREAATRALGGPAHHADAEDPLHLLMEGRPAQRELQLARLAQGLFAVSHTAPEGWRDVPDSFVLPLQRAEAGDGEGLRLQVVVRLSAAEPALVGCDPALHGAGWDTALPLLRLHLRAGTGFYAYSLLESMQLVDLALSVRVRGLRQLALYNQLGPLDPGKPFQPFGPLPAPGSFLVIGSRELASKPLSSLQLNLRWAELPKGERGFAGHYAGWPGERDNHSFRAVPAVLHDGRWREGEGEGAGERLFHAAGPATAVAAHHRLAFDPLLLTRYYRPLPGALPQQAPAFDVGATRALLRLQLSQPAGAFGHAEYALLLSEALSQQGRRPRLRRQPAAAPVLPAAPYTPLLEGLTLDYGSDATVSLRDTAAAAQASERLYHLHPFGLECVFGPGRTGGCRLVPTLAQDGNLFIGLRASAVPARLSLVFRMHDGFAAAQALAPPTTRWHVLVGDRWEPLAAQRVLRDGTAGFQTSGVVVLALPDTMDGRHSVMPDGLYWLAVSANEGFERFAGLLSVQAHGVAAERELPGDGAAALPPLSPLSPQAAFAPPRPVPGLAGLRPVSPATGLRPPQTREQLRVRTGERLRHRERALLPWDFERLVLEHFPEVGQVQAFGAEQVRAAQPKAPRGSVVVAVVPEAHRYDPAGGILRPQLNAVELREIQALLDRLASPFAKVQVRNAVHEQVQVRCTLSLQPHAAEGEVLQRCQRAVHDFLCPWVAGGLDSRFGWVVRAEDIEALLRGVAGVQAVAGLSLLHLTRRDEDEPLYRLGDSARAAPPGASFGAPAGRVVVTPAVPWGLAVPMDQHHFSTTRRLDASSAVPSGIADLAIGRNFIIGDG